MFMLDLILIFSFLADCRKNPPVSKVRFFLCNLTGENPGPKIPVHVTAMTAHQLLPTLRLRPIAVPTKNQ